MKKSVRLFYYRALASASLVLLASSLASTANADEVRFLSDRVPVGIHSDKKDSAKLLNKSLTTGSQVRVIRDDNASGYSLIDAGNGTQGWIPTRFLTRDVPAALRVTAMEKKLVATSDSELQKQLAQLKEDNHKLLEQNRALQQQLDDVHQAAGNVVKLMDQNRELIEKNQLMQSKVDTLEAVKQKIGDNNDMDQFVYGGLLVIATLIVSFIIDVLRKRRSYSSWS